MKIKNISLKQNSWANIIIFCYWLGILHFYVIGMSGHILECICLFFSISAFIIIFFKPKTKCEKQEFNKQLIFLFMLLTIGWWSSTYNQNTTYIGCTFMILGNAGIALLMYYYKISEKISISLFAILSVILMNYYVNHQNFTYIFSISRNYVSVFLLCFLCIICTSCNKRRFFLNILPIIVLLFSCMAGGRGGILSSLILNMFCFYITMIYGMSREKIYYILGLILAGIFLVFIFQFGDWIETVRFFIGKFAIVGFGIDSSRTSLYKPYVLACTNLGNFLFGANIASVVDTHLHNTYLMAHARLGILGLCAFVTLFIRAIIYSWKMGNKMFAALVLTLMIRIFTDTIFVITAFDSIFFYILFLGLSSNTRKIRQVPQT